MDDNYLPKPVARLLEHSGVIIGAAARLVAENGMALELAADVALASEMASSEDFPLVRAYLSGELEKEYPGSGARTAWHLLLGQISKMAIDLGEMAGTQSADVEAGFLYCVETEPLALPHPLTTVQPLDFPEPGHPNLLIYIGESRIIEPIIHNAQKSAGFYSSRPIAGQIVVSRSKWRMSDRVIMRSRYAPADVPGGLVTHIGMFSKSREMVSAVRGVVGKLPIARILIL